MRPERPILSHCLAGLNPSGTREGTSMSVQGLCGKEPLREGGTPGQAILEEGTVTISGCSGG